jgi:hypothetical protein
MVALLLSPNLMLVVPHPAGQIIIRDRFGRLVSNGDATSSGAVKITAFGVIPIRDRHSQHP